MPWNLVVIKLVKVVLKRHKMLSEQQLEGENCPAGEVAGEGIEPRCTQMACPWSV